MTNLEYLKKIKKADEELNLELKLIVKNEDGDSYRQAKALEIIAEQIINLDNTIACVNTTLENIETAIKQRWKY